MINMEGFSTPWLKDWWVEGVLGEGFVRKWGKKPNKKN